MSGFRVLVTGSRDWEGIWGTSRIYRVLNLVQALADDLGATLEIVHGGCPTGADSIAQRWCDRREIESEIHQANWSIGKQAGFIRNQVMVDQGATMCIGFLRNMSKGTSDCLARARTADIPTFTVIWEGGDDVAGGD